MPGTYPRRPRLKWRLWTWQKLQHLLIYSDSDSFLGMCAICLKLKATTYNSSANNKRQAHILTHIRICRHFWLAKWLNLYVFRLWEEERLQWVRSQNLLTMRYLQMTWCFVISPTLCASIVKHLIDKSSLANQYVFLMYWVRLKFNLEI